MTTRKLADFHASLAIHRSMEVRREEFLDYMTFKHNRRPMFTEIFGPLLGLKDEWAAQGATPDELDMSAFSFRRHMSGTVPVSTGFIGGQDEEILEETAEHVIARDRYGRRVKLCKAAATIALPLEYPVRDFDDWRRIRHHYEFSEQRFGEGWEQVAREHLQAGRVLTVGIPGGFDEPRQLMGEENLCVAYYE